VVGAEVDEVAFRHVVALGAEGGEAVLDFFRRAVAPELVTGAAGI